MENSHLDRRTRYTLQAIHQALFALLEQKPLKCITVAELCREADINRGTFYKYYQNVEDLYDKIEYSCAEKIRELLLERDRAPKGEQHFLRAAMQLLQTNDEIKAIAKTQGGAKRLAKKVFVFLSPYVHAEIQKNCPGLPKAEAELLANYTTGGCVWVVSAWMNGGMQQSAEWMEARLVRLMQGAMQTFSPEK